MKSDDTRKLNVLSVTGFCLSLVTLVLDYQNIGCLAGFSLCVAGMVQCLNDRKDLRGIGFSYAGFAIMVIKVALVLITTIGLINYGGTVT